MTSQKTEGEDGLGASGESSAARSSSGAGGATLSLSTRASLGALANALSILTRTVAGLFISPLVIRNLGPELYGAWTMILQTTNYLALGDLRAGGTLKLTLATRQHSEDVESHRRQIGAARKIALYGLPLAALVTVVLVAAGPWIIRTRPEARGDVRMAIGLSALSVGLAPLLNLPGNALRGMNLEYRGAAAVTVVTLLTSIAGLMAVTFGWGLPGLASAGLMGVCATGAVYLGVARRSLPWFGASRPTAEETRRFIAQTAWMLAGSFGAILLNGSDLLVVGIVLGPSAAGTYAVTGAVLRIVGEPALGLLGSANASIAGLCGRREWDRVRRVRSEMHYLVLFLFLALAIGVVALNEVFVGLWVGPEFFGGRALTVLLALCAIQNAVVRIDGVIVDATLQFKERAIVTFASGVAAVVAGGALAWVFGAPGMAVGTILGRSVALVGFPHLIKRRLGGSSALSWVGVARPVLAGGGLLFAALLVGPARSSWMVFGTEVLATGILASTTVWWLGFSAAQRHVLKGRLATQIGALRMRRNRTA